MVMPIGKSALIRQVATYADVYKRELMSPWDIIRLEREWRYALHFFFSHSFYQGRKDTLSQRFQDAAETVVDSHLEAQSLPVLVTTELAEGGRLDNDLRTAGLPKRNDRLMVLDTLRFVDRLPAYNIVSYSLVRIRQGKCLAHYHELMRLKSLGPKTTALYLRDLYFLFGLGTVLSSEDLVLLQPIDTWVRQLAHRVGVISDEKEDQAVIRDAILASCRDAGVDPADFNVGAWWIGAHGITLDTN